MNRINTFIIFLFFLIFAISSFAQSVAWGLSPSNYTNIECLGKHLYKVTNEDGQMTIMSARADGKIEQVITCDEITPFYENWALLIKQESGRRRVIGCLETDGECYLFDNIFYALANQEFYSEGLLTVENAKGEKVYIDYQGNETIGKGKHYYRIKPFSEGFAVVFENAKKSHYIKKDGQTHQIRSSLLNNVTLSSVTSVHHGKALMMSNNMDYFICDMNGNGEKLPQKPKDLDYDYLYRFVFNGKKAQKIPPYDPDYKGEENMVVKLKVDGKGKQVRYGYDLADGTKTVLPCQFAFAEPFIDGFAIVKMADGKLGMLRYLDETANDFRITPIKTTIEYEKPLDKVICQFECLPMEWHGTPIQAEVVNSKDIIVASEGNGVFSFVHCPSGKHPKTVFNINLLSESLILSSQAITIEFKQKIPKCETCHVEINICPHKGKHSRCNTCKKIIDKGHRVTNRCPFDGGKHPDPEPICPLCKKPKKECKFQGNHP